MSMDLAGRRVTLGRLVVMLAASSSETRDMTKLGAVKSDLAPMAVLLSKVEKPDVGFMGAVTFGKLPRVK